MATIKSISAREILDSRGNPTIETEVTFDDGSTGIAQVPSGASTGKYEALELRDGDGSRYHGKGVLKAVENVNEIIFPKLVGQDPGEQKEVDGIMLELDGTENKEELGANAILSVSIAYCKASAVFSGLELYEYIRSIFNSENTEYKIPIPLFNVINGGKHASNNLDIQEFWIIPQEIKSFKEQLRAGSEIFHTLKKLLEENIPQEIIQEEKLEELLSVKKPPLIEESKPSMEEILLEKTSKSNLEEIKPEEPSLIEEEKPVQREEHEEENIELQVPTEKNHFDLGFEFLDKKEYEKAIKEFLQALKEETTNY